MSASDQLIPAATFQVDELARDVGRLRRYVSGDYGMHLLDRIAGRVETLDVLVRPTAAAIYQENLDYGASEDKALVMALAGIDDPARELRRLLGIEGTP